MLASHGSEATRRDGNLGGAGCVLIAQSFRVEDVAGGLAERDERQIEQVVGTPPFP